MRFDEAVLEVPAGGKVMMEMTVDNHEMMVRLLEALLEKPRPEGATAKQALDVLSPRIREGFNRMSVAACTYFGECLINAQPAQTGPVQ